jgi:hypothetical protein
MQTDSELAPNPEPSTSFIVLHLQVLS